MGLALTESEYRQTQEILASINQDPAKAAVVLGRDRFLAYMATHARRDLYYFARAILGYSKMVPHLHLELCRFGQRTRRADGTPLRRKGYLLPRGHYKSTCMTIARPMWELIRDANERIAIFHEKATQAQQFLSQIRHHFEQNVLLRELFPEVIPPHKQRGWRWTVEAINVRRPQEYPEPSIYAAGQGSALQGMHFTRIILDDLIGVEAAGNPEIMEKVIDWITHSDSLFVTPETGLLDLIGTRWAPRDIYSWAQEVRTDMEWFIRSAIIQETDPDTDVTRDVPLFPEEFSIEGLKQLAKEDFYVFSCQYLNLPTARADKELDPTWIRFYDKADVTENGATDAYCVQHERKEDEVNDKVRLRDLSVYIHCDPGIGMLEGHRKAEGRRSKSAITVVGIGHPRKIFMLHAWKQSCSTIQYIDQILRFFEAYQRQLNWITFESHSWTEIVRQGLLQRAAEREILLTAGRVVPYKKSANTKKEARIRKLQPYFARGQIFIEEGMMDLQREYRMFPLDPPWDLLDSLAQGPDSWIFPEEGDSPYDEDDEEPWDALNETYKRGRTKSTGY